MARARCVRGWRWRRRRALQPEGVDGETKMLKALDAGLAKVMSKMGISVVDSYRGAHLFDILGLHASVVERCFLDTPAPLSGIGFAELERSCARAGDEATRLRPTCRIMAGCASARPMRAEPHAWQPPTVKALQTVVGSARGVAAASDPDGSVSDLQSQRMRAGSGVRCVTWWRCGRRVLSLRSTRLRSRRACASGLSRAR